MRVPPLLVIAPSLEEAEQAKEALLSIYIDENGHLKLKFNNEVSYSKPRGSVSPKFDYLIEVVPEGSDLNKLEFGVYSKNDFGALIYISGNKDQQFFDSIDVAKKYFIDSAFDSNNANVFISAVSAVVDTKVFLNPVVIMSTEEITQLKKDLWQAFKEQDIPRFNSLINRCNKNLEEKFLIVQLTHACASDASGDHVEHSPISTRKYKEMMEIGLQRSVMLSKASEGHLTSFSDYLLSLCHTTFEQYSSKSEIERVIFDTKNAEGYSLYYFIKSHECFKADELRFIRDNTTEEVIIAIKSGRSSLENFLDQATEFGWDQEFINTVMDNVYIPDGIYSYALERNNIAAIKSLINHDKVDIEYAPADKDSLSELVFYMPESIDDDQIRQAIFELVINYLALDSNRYRFMLENHPPDSEYFCEKLLAPLSKPDLERFLIAMVRQQNQRMIDYLINEKKLDINMKDSTGTLRIARVLDKQVPLSFFKYLVENCKVQFSLQDIRRIKSNSEHAISYLWSLVNKKAAVCFLGSATKRRHLSIFRQLPKDVARLVAKEIILKSKGPL